jgi:5-methylcytosine-specific restriction endonuclease McrA
MKRNMASQQLARVRIIKERGNKCQNCGYDGYVELHHIKEVQNGGTLANENLVLLCELCHANAHGWKKRKFLDAHREQWGR